MERRRRLKLLVLVLLALAMRLPGHLTTGLWYDEIQTLVEAVRQPLATVLGDFSNDNNHPLYSLCAKLAVAALGESALALRLPALLFGVLSVGALYLYAARVAPQREALLAALLLAVSSHHVWFSQNARGYTLLLLLVLAASLAFEELLAGGRRRALPLYAVALALAAYTHLSALFVGAGHLVAERLAAGSLATRHRDLRALAALALAAGLTLALYAPMLPDLLTFFWQPATATAAAAPRDAWGSSWWAVAATARSLGLGLVPGLAALGGGALLLLAGALDYGRQSLPRLATFVVPPGLLALALVALGRSLWPRFFFFAAGFVLLIAARGLTVASRALARRLPGAGAERSQRALFALASAIAVAACLVPLARVYALPKQDFEGAMAYVERERAADEVVLTAGLAVMPYRSYYRTDYLPVATPAELDRALAGRRAAYLLSTLPDYLERHSPDLVAAVAARGALVARFRGSVGDGDLLVYRIPARAGADSAPAP